MSMEELLEEYNGRVAPGDQVSERTLRYYVVEGLLPKPERRGQRALYTEGHLNRLLLIRRLKEEEFQPLAQIKAILAELDDAEVGATLERAAEPPERARAKQLVERLLQESALQPARSRSRPPVVPPLSVPPTPREERWRHIELVDGLLLLVRQPAPHETEEMVRKLIEASRTLRND